jgi:tetratricopeptide (TPR) repeat protein
VIQRNVRLKPDTAVAICVLLLACAVSSCSQSPKSQPPSGSATQARTPDGRELRPVTLPDVSQMAPSAQKQIRDQYASLQQAISNHRTVTELSNAYGEMGKLLMAAQDYDPAEASFLDAQSLDSSQFRWPYYLAHLYRARGEIDKSTALFERALQLNPDDPAALVWLGNAYLSSGRPDAARPKFEKSLALVPGSLSARYGLGRAALALNDPRSAAMYLEEILKIDPTATGAHYPLSQAYAALGDTAKASEHLRLRQNRDIIPTDPLMTEIEQMLQSPQTFETLGIRALDGKDWSGAAAQFRRGLELEPDSASLKFRLATTLNMMGDGKGSEALFEEVVRTSPDYFPAQFSLGVLRQAQGHHDEAVERFSAAIAQRPDYAEAHLRLAVSLRHLGRPGDALAHYQQVMAANPQNFNAQFGYATTLAQLHRDQEARTQLMEGMKAFPDQLIFTHGLARLLATSPDDRVRDGQRAMALVQDLVKRGRTLELGETLAMTLAELGQYDQAVAIQRDVMKSADKAGMTTGAKRMGKNLSLYERREPCRTPWETDEIQ